MGHPCDLGVCVCVQGCGGRGLRRWPGLQRGQSWVTPADLSPVSSRGLTSPSLAPAALLSLQLARYTKEGFLHLGALGTTTLLPDTRCLVDNSKSRLPQLLDCDKVKSSLYKRWNFIQVSAPRTGPEQVGMLWAPPGRGLGEGQPEVSQLRAMQGDPNRVGGGGHGGRQPLGSLWQG